MPLVNQIRSKSIISYYKRDPHKGHAIVNSVGRKKSIENLTAQSVDRKTYSGEVTAGSLRRLTRSMENMLQVVEWKFFENKGVRVPFKISFATLTVYSFGRRVPGREAHKKLLEPLLLWLRRSKKMACYVWKAELQTKRKDCHQIHYHLLTDIYIDKFELRDKWNELQRAAGYLDYFNEKFGHWKPNSTDIHKTHNKKSLIGYLKKKIIRHGDKKKYQRLKNSFVAELAKNEQNNENIEGKIWDCSLNLKVAFYECADYADVTNKLAKMCIDGEADKIELPKCTVHILNSYHNASDLIPWPERHFYNAHIDRMRMFYRNKSPDAPAAQSYVNN